jgi:hypothetical protein
MVFSGMLRRKRDVVGGMPVLGQHYILKALGELVDQWNDGVAILHGQTATGGKAILDINDDQRRVGSRLDGRRRFLLGQRRGHQQACTECTRAGQQGTAGQWG